MWKLQHVKSSQYSKVKGQILIKKSRSLHLCCYSNISVSFSFFLVPISSENFGSKRLCCKKFFIIMYHRALSFIFFGRDYCENWNFQFFLWSHLLFSYINFIQCIIHDSDDIYCKSKNIKTVKFFNMWRI